MLNSAERMDSGSQHGQWSLTFANITVCLSKWGGRFAIMLRMGRSRTGKV